MQVKVDYNPSIITWTVSFKTPTGWRILQTFPDAVSAETFARKKSCYPDLPNVKYFENGEQINKNEESV